MNTFFEVCAIAIFHAICLMNEIHQRYAAFFYGRKINILSILHQLFPHGDQIFHQQIDRLFIFSDTHTTYYGKALAVVRGGDAPGKITVTVKAKGLQAKMLELEVI